VKLAEMGATPKPHPSPEAPTTAWEMRCLKIIEVFVLYGHMDRRPFADRQVLDMYRSRVTDCKTDTANVRGLILYPPFVSRVCSIA